MHRLICTCKTIKVVTRKKLIICLLTRDVKFCLFVFLQIKNIFFYITFHNILRLVDFYTLSYARHVTVDGVVFTSIMYYWICTICTRWNCLLWWVLRTDSVGRTSTAYITFDYLLQCNRAFSCVTIIVYISYYSVLWISATLSCKQWLWFTVGDQWEQWRESKQWRKQ